MGGELHPLPQANTGERRDATRGRPCVRSTAGSGGRWYAAGSCRTVVGPVVGPVVWPVVECRGTPPRPLLQPVTGGIAMPADAVAG
jgi:hypothetical protein